MSCRSVLVVAMVGCGSAPPAAPRACTLEEVPTSSLQSAPGSSPLLVADLDRDGHPDLAAGGAILLGGGGQLRPTSAVPLTSLADMNHDGVLDAVSVHVDQANVFIGNGDGTFQDPLNTYFGANCDIFTSVVTDVDGGSPDVVASGVDLEVVNNPRLLCIASNYGNGDLRAVTYAGVDSDCATGFAVVGALDVDRDGNQDLVLACSSASHVCLGDGAGSFHTVYSYPVTTWNPASFADLDRDGNLDIVQTDGAIAISLGNGDGTFRPLTLVSGVSGAHATAVGDVDGDELPDLFVEGDASSTVWLGNGDGTFRFGIEYAVGAKHSAGTAVLDLDGDGALDFAAATDGDAVVYWLNRCD